MKTVNLKQNSENENENELSSIKLKRLKKKVKKNYWHWKYYGSIKVSRKENDEIEYSVKTLSDLWGRCKSKTKKGKRPSLIFR